MVALVACALVSMINVQHGKATGPVFIMADGSIYPPTAPIMTLDNVTYTLTGNINGSLVIERDNIRLDGAGYALEGTGVYPSMGIQLSGRHNVTVENIDVEGFYYGIWINSSSSTTLTRNKITANVAYSIYIERSSDNIILENEVKNNDEYGLELHFSTSNNIAGNNITDNGSDGIYLSGCSSTSLRNNLLANNTHNLIIWGSELSHFLSNIDTSNTVDGKPIYYLANEHDRIIDEQTCPNIGYLAIVNSTNMVVQNLNVANNGEGVLLAYTNDSTVQNVTATMNLNGISLVHSCDNVITGNNITDNGTDISLTFSSTNNRITENSLTAGGYRAISIRSSHNNIIEGNRIDNRKYRSTGYAEGIGIEESSNITIIGNHMTECKHAAISFSSYSRGNRIFHNNFINNSMQIVGTCSETVWDNGYPSGGNYWSDYSGSDLCRGPNQNITSSDGIGDSPYEIDGASYDRYPLMKPWQPTTIASDLNHDGTVNIIDIVMISSIYNSKRGDANWNEQADLTKPYGIINVLDVLTCSAHYGQKYP